MNRRLLALPAALLALTGLAGCGQDDPDAATSPSSASAATDLGDESPSAADSATASPSTGTSAASAATSSAGAITVGKTVEDPEFGNQVTVESYVPNFAVPQAVIDKYAAFDGSRVVLVKVKITAGQKYYASMNEGDLWLTKTSNGTDIPALTLPEVSDAVTAAGFTPLLPEAKPGASAEGWVIYNVRTEEPTLTFSLKRLAYTVMGSDKAIPKAYFDVVLPPA